MKTALILPFPAHPPEVVLAPKDARIGTLAHHAELFGKQRDRYREIAVIYRDMGMDEIAHGLMNVVSDLDEVIRGLG